MGTLIWFGTLAVLWLLWVAVSWSVLLREKRRPLTLAPMLPDHAFVNDSYIAKMRKEAESAGFVALGMYVDPDSGWMRGTIVPLVSADGEMLLLIIRGKLLRKIALKTSMTDGVWVVTMSAIGDPDCTGLSAEEGVPTSTTLAPVLARHRGRLIGRDEEIIPWNPEEVIQDLIERDRVKTQRLLETGMARIRDAMTGRWSYTLKGTARQRAALKMNFTKSMDAVKAEAEEKKRLKKLARQAK